MTTILSIQKVGYDSRLVAIVDVDKYNIEKRIKFIAAVLDIVIMDIYDYYKLYEELETNKTITISDKIEMVYLTFREIAEY